MSVFDDMSGAVFANRGPSKPLTMADIDAFMAPLLKRPPVAVRITVHPDMLQRLKDLLPAKAGTADLPEGVPIYAGSRHLSPHHAIVHMSDGTLCLLDLRARVRQSLHDCRGMLRGARKRHRRAFREARAEFDFTSGFLGRRAERLAAKEKHAATLMALRMASDRLALALEQRARRARSAT